MQSLRAQNFESMYRVLGCASTGLKASGLGDIAPEGGEYLSNKYEIQTSPNINIISPEAFLQL